MALALLYANVAVIAWPFEDRVATFGARLGRLARVGRLDVRRRSGTIGG
ncbi:hypothetical protein BH24ACT3_BH24ACT3_15310 [soil metagenome]